MAPAKQKKGAQPSAVKAAAPAKLTRKEKSAANKARYTEVRDVVQASVRNQRHGAIKDLPRKSVVNAKIDRRGPDSRQDADARRLYLAKTGLPSPDEYPYTAELDARLFQLLSVGTSLDDIVQLKGTPPLYVLLGWLSDETHKFALTYTRAKKLLVSLYEDRALSVAIKPMLSETRITRTGTDFKGNPIDSEEVRIADNVERAKLAHTAYQWALGWMIPKKHSRRAEILNDGPNKQLEGLFAALKAGPVE